MPIAKGEFVAGIIAQGDKPTRAAFEMDELLPELDERRA
jgi:hypothetical protein